MKNYGKSVKDSSKTIKMKDSKVSIEYIDGRWIVYDNFNGVKYECVELEEAMETVETIMEEINGMDEAVEKKQELLNKKYAEDYTGAYGTFDSKNCGKSTKDAPEKTNQLKWEITCDIASDDSKTTKWTCTFVNENYTREYDNIGSFLKAFNIAVTNEIKYTRERNRAIEEHNKKYAVGDSVNFKDGRTGIVEEYDDKYYYVRDNNANIVKIKKVKDTKYTPKDMFEYLCNINYRFDVTREEWVDSILSMLIPPIDMLGLQEYIEMNGSNEEMNAQILQFVKENPNFNWKKIRKISDSKKIKDDIKDEYLYYTHIDNVLTTIKYNNTSQRIISEKIIKNDPTAKSIFIKNYQDILNFYINNDEIKDNEGKDVGHRLYVTPQKLSNIFKSNNITEITCEYLDEYGVDKTRFTPEEFLNIVNSNNIQIITVFDSTIGDGSVELGLCADKNDIFNRFLKDLENGFEYSNELKELVINAVKL